MDSSKTLFIRKAGPEDIHPLKKLGVQTFTEAFAEANAAENMELYLAQAFAEERIRQELCDPCSSFYLARANDTHEGYLKLNHPESSDVNLPREMEIERIYVTRSQYGTGMGQALLDHALKLSRERGCSSVWLGVWEHNPRAIRFYEKNGFTVYGSHPFMLGHDRQTDLLMRKNVG